MIVTRYYFAYVFIRGFFDRRCPTGGVTVRCHDRAGEDFVGIQAWEIAFNRYPQRPWEMLFVREVGCKSARRHALLMERDYLRKQAAFETLMSS